MKNKYSIFSLIKNAFSYHENWQRAWRDPEPKKEYDAIIVGGGGHGLATAFYLAKKHNTEFKIWGDGKSLREFIYSKDIGKVSLWALENYNSGTPLIISPSQEVSIQELSETIAKIMGYKGSIKYDTTKPSGQHRKPSDNSKFKELCPNFEYTPLEEGLEETINFFINNYDRGIRR